MRKKTCEKCYFFNRAHNLFFFRATQQNSGCAVRRKIKNKLAASENFAIKTKSGNKCNKSINCSIWLWDIPWETRLSPNFPLSNRLSVALARRRRGALSGRAAPSRSLGYKQLHFRKEILLLERDVCSGWRPQCTDVPAAKTVLLHREYKYLFRLK